MKKQINHTRQDGQIALVLTILSAGLLVAGALTGSQIAQKTTPDFRTTAAGTTWNQCNDAHDNLPCGSCEVTKDSLDIKSGKMTFSCELLCSGSADNCPGGKGVKYTIEHVYETCDKGDNIPCGWTYPDLTASKPLQGGPFEIVADKAVNRINGTGTFPPPDCGRIQVDVKMSAQGTKVAGDYRTTGKDCDGTGPAPLPTNTPGQTRPTVTPIPGCVSSGCWQSGKTCCYGYGTTDPNCNAPDNPEHRTCASSAPTPTPTCKPGSCCAAGGYCEREYIIGCTYGEYNANCALDGLPNQLCCKKNEPTPTVTPTPACVGVNQCYKTGQDCCAGFTQFPYPNPDSYAKALYPCLTDGVGVCLPCGSEKECIHTGDSCCPGYKNLNGGYTEILPVLFDFWACKFKGYDEICVKMSGTSSAPPDTIKIGSFDPKEMNTALSQWTNNQITATQMSAAFNSNPSLQMRSCYPNLPADDPNSCLEE